jgi:hypothetical protein
MPYVTDSRPLPGIRLPDYHYFNKVYNTDEASGSGFTVLPGSQTTYSYRNSRRGDQDDRYQYLSGSDLAKSVGDEFHATNGGLDTGHEFWTRKDWYELDPTHLHFEYPNSYYDGMVYPSIVGVDLWPDLAEPSTSDLEVLGARAVSGTLPDRPIAGLAAFLGELHEGLPRMPLQALARRGPNALDQEFLNQQFGIRPFIGDLQKLAQAVITGDILLQRYNNQASLLTRRKLDLGSQTTLRVQPDAYMEVNLGTRGGTPHPYYWLENYGGYWTCIDEMTHSARFAGQYERFVPINDSFFRASTDYARRANKLLGTEITPSVVYQITPWSWLLDWFGNFNVFMTNVSYLNGNDTILRYGYVTHLIEATRTWTRQGPLRTGDSRDIVNTVVLKHHVRVMRRVKASPYGFGINLPDMSPLRWAILAALGKTRAPSLNLR